MSNLPPGGGFFRDGEDIALTCAQGHEWTAAGYFELGGFFLHDEETVCPFCGLDPLD